MQNKLIGKMIAIFAIAIVLFQSFSVPILAATVKPWSGNPWTGDSWEGNPWSGSELKWEGDPWEGQGTKGNSWAGNSTDTGNPWVGTDWSSTPWYLDPWSANGWTADGWNANGWTADGWNANGWNANGWSANGWNANGWTANGWNANGWTANGWNANGWQGNVPGTGGAWSGNGWNGNPYNPSYNPLNPGGNNPAIQLPGNNPNVPQLKPYDPSKSKDNGSQESSYTAYDWLKFGAKDVGLATFVMMKNQDIKLMDLKNWNPKSKQFYMELLKTSYKFTAKDISLLEVGADGLDVKQNVLEFRNNLQNLAIYSGQLKGKMNYLASNPQAVFNKIKAMKVSDAFAHSRQFGINRLAEFQGMAPLPKLNVIASAVGAGFSLYESGKSTVDLFKAKTSDDRFNAGVSLAQNSGDFLMNAGMVAAAFPGGQVVGGAMLAAGALL